MPSDDSFLVEDFIQSITTQLDRVQDALRVKAINRPLTYALKDLQLELKVFVEMDAKGNIRFRNSGSNEAGASTVQLSFTTITKPMIEENTISLAAARSASLDELGLAPDEQARLEKLGVRTASQLNQLRSTAGVQGMARLTDVSVDRLRSALDQSAPRIGNPAPPRPAPPKAPPVRPLPPTPRAPQPPILPRGPVVRPPVVVASPPPIKIRRGVSLLELPGANLLSASEAPRITLNSVPLDIADWDDHRIVVALPHDAESGDLQVDLGSHGGPQTYALEMEGSSSYGDEWSPGGGLS